jgi:hypothetical protein
LQSSIGTSYRWSNGDTTREISVNRSGNYSVVVTNANGCLSPVSQDFTITLDTTFCQPRLTLISTRDSISTNISADSYLWYRNGTLILSENNERTIVIPGNGSYTVRGVYNGRGVGTISNNVFVNTVSSCNCYAVIPPAIPIDSINRTICFGSNYQFRNRTINTAGNYSDTLIVGTNADSIFKLNLTIRPEIATPSFTKVGG